MEHIHFLLGLYVQLTEYLTERLCDLLFEEILLIISPTALVVQIVGMSYFNFCAVIEISDSTDIINNSFV